MHKEKKDKHFLNKPVYEGGPKAMKNFVREHLKYPEEALKAKVEGSVKVKYSIDFKGNVTSTKVISTLGHGCDEEAARIVKMFKLQIQKNRKIKVVFYKNITIHFRLPKPQLTPVATNIQYNITITKQPKKPTVIKKEEQKKSGSYSYTVEL